MNTKNCFLHDANMFVQQGMGHGPRTLALRVSQGRVHRERPNWTSAYSHRH